MSENEFSVNEFIVREMGYPGAIKQEVVGELVRCSDCKHRPIKGDGDIVYAPNDINGWDDETCPCLCEDCYYNWMPDDDFFCGKGERREDE